MATRWVTADEAARLLGRSGESVRKLINRHRRQVERREAGDGHRYVVDLDDMQRLVRKVGR